MAPHLGQTDGTLRGARAFGCLAMVSLWKKDGWHDLFRIGAGHSCQQWSRTGRLHAPCLVSDRVSEPLQRLYGGVRFWQEEQIETNLRE